MGIMIITHFILCRTKISNQLNQWTIWASIHVNIQLMAKYHNVYPINRDKNQEKDSKMHIFSIKNGWTATRMKYKSLSQLMWREVNMFNCKVNIQYDIVADSTKITNCALILKRSFDTRKPFLLKAKSWFHRLQYHFTYAVCDGCITYSS